MQRILIAVLLVAWAAPALAEDPPVFVSKFGVRGTQDGELLFPSGIAVNGLSHLYVTDYGHRIQSFDSTGVLLGVWGRAGFGPVEFDYPVGVALDATGNAFVADWGNNRIQKLSSGGALLAEWGSWGDGDGQFNGPTSVALDAQGFVYVADQLNNRIQKFDGNGTYISQWGGEGSDPGKFWFPRSIAIDGNGNIFVSDWLDRIQKFDVEGNYLLEWGSPGTGQSQFKSPIVLKTDADGNVYAADAGNHRIQKFTGEGMFVYILGSVSGSPGANNGEFNFPTDLAINAVGDIFVADSNGNRIQKFSPAPVTPQRPVNTVATTWGRIKNLYAANMAKAGSRGR